jgi:mRNA interferase MazF
VAFEAFDVVVVPFPFTDRSSTRRRPALVLSRNMPFNQQLGQSVLAMITSAKHSDWPLDTAIDDLDAAGLPTTSIVRMKLFTLDDRLVIRKAGQLAAQDARNVSVALENLLGIGPSQTPGHRH